MSVRPAKTQISLGIRPAWSESSLCAQWVAKDPSFLHADSKESDQTGRMPRLIWVFAGLHSFCLFCHVAAHLVLMFFQSRKVQQYLLQQYWWWAPSDSPVRCETRRWCQECCKFINPLTPSGLFYPCKLDKSISCFRGVWCIFFFIEIPVCKQCIPWSDATFWSGSALFAYGPFMRC